MTAGEVILCSSGIAAAAAAGVFCRAVFMTRSQICGNVIFRGLRTDPPRIALTFDDGPDPVNTPKILDCLDAHRAQATFFVVGKHAVKHPHLVKQVHEQGHIVANHSFSHDHLGSVRRDRYWEDEIRRTDEIIAETIGKRPAMFRPPMGFKTFHIMRAARKHGHAVITWSRRAFDGVRVTPEHILRRLMKVRAADIVLLHDGAVPPFRISADATAAALDRALDIWHERGMAIQRLDEMLGLPAYAELTESSANQIISSAAIEHAGQPPARSRATA